MMRKRTSWSLASAFGSTLLACEASNDGTPGDEASQVTDVSMDASTAEGSGATADDDAASDAESDGDGGTTSGSSTTANTSAPTTTTGGDGGTTLSVMSTTGNASSTTTGGSDTSAGSADSLDPTADGTSTSDGDDTTSDTGMSAARPSPGCGSSGRPQNGRVTVDNDHIYTFPESYDGNTPFPLLYGFHAAGNPIEQIFDLTNGSAFEANYVRAFGKSMGNEWTMGNDQANVLRIYDDLMNNYCIDMNRVFATGHSSGAGLIMQLLENQATHDHLNFKAVAPVAAWVTGPPRSDIAVMYIQAMFDTVRMSSGSDVVDLFRNTNGCQPGSTPYTGASSCMSGNTMVDPGCIVYDGCSEPTVWCSHNDPQYNDTYHGVPCFAVDAMVGFFTNLP